MDFYKEFIEEIENKIQENKEENKTIYLKLQEQEMKLNQIEKVVADMPRIIEVQEEEQTKEIKSKLNKEVNNIIYQIKLENLQLKKQEIRKSKNIYIW